jgi:hypothetical protein
MAEPIPVTGSVVFDCTDPDRLASFWGSLLGVGEALRFPGFIWLEPQREGAFSLTFQQVPDPTPGKNRLHLDHRFDGDLEVVRQRVESLGGSLVREHDEYGYVWSVFADPEGNQFCVGHPAGEA